MTPWTAAQQSLIISWNLPQVHVHWVGCYRSHQHQRNPRTVDPGSQKNLALSQTLEFQRSPGSKRMMMQEQEKGKGQDQSGAAGEKVLGRGQETGVNHSRLFSVGSRLRKAPRNQGRGHGLWDISQETQTLAPKSFHAWVRAGYTQQGWALGSLGKGVHVGLGTCELGSGPNSMLRIIMQPEARLTSLSLS